MPKSSVILDLAKLSATDPDDAAAGLVFEVLVVAKVHFELVANPGVAAAGITRRQVAAGEAVFLHDEGLAARPT